jgi:hypothetical protein
LTATCTAAARADSSACQPVNHMCINHCTVRHASRELLCRHLTATCTAAARAHSSTCKAVRSSPTFYLVAGAVCVTDTAEEWVEVLHNSHNQ